MVTLACCRCRRRYDWRERGVAKKNPTLGTRRTRDHIRASQSQNYIEKFFIDKGHTVDRPAHDYGTDLLVNTFDEYGYAEGGDIRIQLKSGDTLDYSIDGTFISYGIEVKHYHYWKAQRMPVFLVLYDAGKTKAYWLYLQTYFAAGNKPKKNAATMTVRVPMQNEFTEQTVDYMRERKNAIVEIEVEHED